MKNIVLSVSNYVGPAREDIFAMATRLGASATRSMTMSNTHLITAWYGYNGASINLILMSLHVL